LPVRREAIGSRARRLARRVVMLILVGTAAAGAGEVGLRLVGFRFDASVFTSDQELGWALRPGAHGWNVSEGEAYIRVNRHGQLDLERRVDKPDGSVRVVVLGDSMVEARQVPLEERFTQIAERALTRCSGQPVEVLNFGVAGYGTAQELIQLRQRVWAFAPDLVVLGVYLGNDLADNLRTLDYTAPGNRPFYVRQAGGLVLDASFRQNQSSARRSGLRDFSADVMNRSRLLQLTNQARLALRAASREASSVSANGVPPGFIRRGAYLEPTSSVLAEAWATTEALIRAVRDEVQQRGADFALLYLPMVAETDSDAGRREAFARELGEEGTLEYPRNRVGLLASREGMRFVDPTPALLERAVSSRTFVNGFPNTGPNEGHLNRHGHQVVGETLSRALCSSTLRPRR
jgi:lysophospholipase L1-like esterase